MTDHPIIPPPEQLVEQWRAAWVDGDGPEGLFVSVATQAARWGADQELEACISWIQERPCTWTAEQLRAARRPEPKGLAEEALTAFYRQTGGALTPESQVDAETIRRALERLQELEGQDDD